METTVPQNALKTLGFLNGDFMMSDTSGQSRGFRMIFGVLMTLKMTCLQFLPRIYMGIANGITMTCGPDSFFKFIFGGLLVPFLATIVFFHTHLYNGVLPFIKNNKDMWIMFYLCFLAMFIINYLFVLCTSAHDFNNSQDRVALEEAAKQNPLLSKKPPTCSKCGISNVLRANHCVTCNTHTAKYHRHSLIFNKCIGAGNMFFYTIFQFFIALLMFIGVATLLLEKDETFVMTKPKKMLFHLLVIIYLLIGIGRVHAFAKNITYIYYNITEYEATNYKQLAYLWKSMQKEFYNPFDKGPAKNFKEELFTVMNYQEETRKKADVSMDEMKLKENPEDLEDKERKTVEDEKNRIINWRTEKILTLTDIYNSPMRKFFLDYFNKKKTQKKNADSDSD